MAAEMKYLDWLLHPVMELVHCGSFPDVLNLALDRLEYFLYDWLFLEVVNLLIYLGTMDVKHGLAIQEDERGGYVFIGVLFGLVPLEILCEHFTERIAIESQSVVREYADIKRVISKTTAQRGW